MNLQPSQQEYQQLRKIADEIISKIKIKDTLVILGGSAAKDTFLPGNKELDIFVKFDYKKYNKKSDKISKILYSYLKRKFSKITILHGSRDYFQVKHKNYTIELIPILDISSHLEAKNITDISPLHIEWVNKNINNLADDIRKAKLFCYAHHIYGAESHIKGFSGYALEILTIHYKGFDNFIKAASKWKLKQVIDHYNIYKDAFSSLNYSKILSSLILIDPVQSERNVSAGLSEQSFFKFIEASKNYLNHPSDQHFKHQEITKQYLAKKFKSKNIIVIEAHPKKLKSDVAGSKIFKIYEYIFHNLKNNEFNITSKDIIFNDKAVMYFILDKMKLSDKKKHYGPPLNNEKHLILFRKKWKNYKIQQERNKPYVIIKRKYNNAGKLIKDLIKSKNIASLASSIKIL